MYTNLLVIVVVVVVFSVSSINRIVNRTWKICRNWRRNCWKWWRLRRMIRLFRKALGLVLGKVDVYGMSEIKAWRLLVEDFWDGFFFPLREVDGAKNDERVVTRLCIFCTMWSGRMMGLVWYCTLGVRQCWEDTAERKLMFILPGVCVFIPDAFERAPVLLKIVPSTWKNRHNLIAFSVSVVVECCYTD